MKTNTERPRASVDSGSHRPNNIRPDDGRSSVVSSSRAKIFYSNEFLGQSDADLWPYATKAATKGRSSEKDDVRADCDILKNMASRVLTMDMLNERAARCRERGITAPVKNGVTYRLRILYHVPTANVTIPRFDQQIRNPFSGTFLLVLIHDPTCPWSPQLAHCVPT